MITLTLNGKPLEVEPGLTVLQAAKQAGVDIPHLCYHPAFVPEGSCRLCAVEIEGSPKLELACATPVRRGMVVRTETPLVVEARQSVLEFLLAEHPLDCPVCDKAGDCKLQDYYAAYSLTPGGYAEDKLRRNKKIPLGKNLLLDRERCVLCTRCLRFLDTVTGTSELGLFERGVHSEVGVYEGRPVDNNYSGCLAEICPVGAITDTDFRFRTRQWFLEAKDALCPLCGRGCNIVLESHPGFPRVPGTKKVLRVRARRNDRVNGHWICDVGRYGYEYLQQDRCLKLFGPATENLGLRNVPEFLSYLAARLKTMCFKGAQARAAVVLSDWMTDEELYLAKSVFQKDLEFRRLHLLGPRDGTGDGFLLTAEKSPNRRGARTLGFNLEEPRLADLARETDLLLVFGSSLAEWFPAPEIKAALAGVKFKALFTPRLNGLESAFDVVIPTALPAEKEGSFTNCDGLVQQFPAALEPAGESWAEWRLLVEMGKDIDRNHGFYRPLRSALDIRGIMS